MFAKKVQASVTIGDEYLFDGDSVPFDTFGDFFQHLLNPVYVAAGIIMLFLLIFGGFSVIIGAGQQDSGKMKQGQKAITAAVVGFIVIIMSYFVIQLIEVITGVNILDSGI